MATRTHFRTCSLCEAMCGLKIELEGDRVLSIRGDEHDPLSGGYICPKALALQDLHEDPDRLRQPMRRRSRGKTSDVWEPIGWDEAIAETTQRIHALQSEHGRDSVAAYLGNPNVHNLGMMLYGPSFLRALRSKNRFSATSVDQLPAMLLSYWMFGHQLLLPIPDVDRTDFFLVVGANPLASNGSLMTAPGMRHRLKALRERGGKLVVLDPRRSETAAVADAHHFVRPGTDAFLLLAIVREVIERSPSLATGDRPSDQAAARLGELGSACDGLAAVRDAVAPFSPELAAKRCGVAPELVGDLAGQLLERERAVVYGRVGACTQAYGALTMWAINLLNVLTGHLDRVGGAMFTEPALDVVDAPRGFGVGRGSFGRWRSRVRGLPEFGGELPAVTLAEEITDREVEGTRIRGLITIAGNPVLSTPNGRRLDAALDELDFFVAIDPYINETTRHADLILPPTSVLERSHYDVVFAALAVRNVSKWSPPAISPPSGSKHDWQIVHALGEGLARLRGGGGLGPRTRERALGWLGPDRLVDLGLRLGRHKLSRRKLLRAPHGVDLGPLRPCLAARLPTGRIDLAPEAVVEDVDRLLADDGFEGDSLVLIGRRHLRSNNSWMHNVEKLVRGPARCTALMHPADAADRGLEAGSTVAIESRVGRVELPLELTDGMMRGVVSVPHGWGHGRDGTRLRVARENPGASVNDLTDETLVDAVSGVAALSGVRIQVTSATTA